MHAQRFASPAFSKQRVIVQMLHFYARTRHRKLHHTRQLGNEKLTWVARAGRCSNVNPQCQRMLCHMHSSRPLFLKQYILCLIASSYRKGSKARVGLNSSITSTTHPFCILCTHQGHKSIGNINIWCFLQHASRLCINVHYHISPNPKMFFLCKTCMKTLHRKARSKRHRSASKAEI